MRERKKWAVTGILLAAALTLQVLARYTKGFADWYGTGIYPRMVFVVGGFFSVFPFSAAELGVYLFLAWIALYTAAAVILAYRHRPGILKNYCASLALTASALLLIFTLFCGINYHSVCFSENEGFSMERSSKEELRELCVFLAEEINRCDMALAEKANRGDTALPMEGDVRFTSPDMMEQQAVLAIKEAGKTYESLSGFTPEPKAVWQSGLHGIRSAAVCLQRSYAGIQPCYGRAVECRGEGCISGDLRRALSECERGFAGGQHILASV